MTTLINAFTENLQPQDSNIIKPSKLIHDGRFPVYLIQSEDSSECQVMKVFPLRSSGPSRSFIQESLITTLSHPNIITPIKTEVTQQIDVRGTILMSSIIVTKFASLGSLSSLVKNKLVDFDEGLTRTLFRQIISALRYIHANNISHMDLKTDNFMMDSDGNLKLIDFEMSYKKGDQSISSLGTKYYRAPELVFRQVNDPFASDIFSAGIILFVMMTRGRLPQTENICIDNVNYFQLLQEENEKFWSKHCKGMGKEESFFSEDFKELFNMMTKVDPKERFTLEQIEKSKWFNGPIYSEVEVKSIMEKIL